MDGSIKYPLQEVLYQGESIFLYRVTRFQASTVHENPILRPNQSPYIIVGLWTQILLQHIKLTTVVRFWCLRSPDMILGNSNYKKNKIFKTLANRGPFTPEPDEVQKNRFASDIRRISERMDLQISATILRFINYWWLTSLHYPHRTFHNIEHKTKKIKTSSKGYSWTDLFFDALIYIIVIVTSLCPLIFVH